MQQFSVINLCLFFTVFTTFTKGQGRLCTTPNGESATCVKIHSCQILLNAVTTKDQQQRQFLKQSQCGFQREPLVCCGSFDNYRPQGSFEEDYGNAGGWGNNNNNNQPPAWGGGATNNGNRAGAGSGLPDKRSCGFMEVDRILGGQATSLREFPWMALLQYRKKSGSLVFSCGGTLISSRFVLTAAHCVQGQILSKIGPLVNVRLGEYNTDTPTDCTNQYGFQICNDQPFDAAVERIVPHAGYSDTNVDRYNDIALVKLKREAPNTDFIKPICLPTGADKADVGQKLVVAGWGRTEFSNTSPVKLKLWVPVVSKTECSNRFRSAGISIGDKQVCAGGERGKDSCYGDSGGPLMATTKSDAAQWYLEGVVSFGAKCGSEGWPGIYTKVGEYLDWIKSNAV